MSAQKPKVRQKFNERVLDNGDGTGKVEYQLDGSGIASFDCKIRKEPWDKKQGEGAAPATGRMPPQRE